MPMLPTLFLLVAASPVLPSADPAAIPTYHEAEPHPLRGLYAIWYGKRTELLDLPYLRGGQVMLQWAELEPAPGQYDFTKLDAAIHVLASAGRPTTVQVNGNRKPAWLFDRVPYTTKKLSNQINDQQGSLQYWHPAHRDAYLAFIAAYGKHLCESPDRDLILGVRLNFNAFGTEHLHLAKQEQPVDWILPPGVPPGPEFSREARDAYASDVVGAFVKAFPSGVRVFVRNSIGEELREPYREQFETGRLCWFHTSSEVQPRYEIQYRTFLDSCRSGETLAYAEPWAGAWGRHGGVTDRRWCSPPQWNYWRLLCDLHCGVSFIACYSNDLQVAATGQPVGQVECLPEYQAEFQAAFEFAGKYAGYHASPRQSPGAWIAFRENHHNDMLERELTDLTGDYTFLMGRLPDHSRGEGVKNVGPATQRYGSRARILPAGETMRLKVDEVFCESLRGQPATVAVTYLDDQTAGFTLNVSGQSLTVHGEGSGKWLLAELELPSANLKPDDEGAVITLRAAAETTLHMVEVRRR